MTQTNEGLKFFGILSQLNQVSETNLEWMCQGTSNVKGHFSATGCSFPFFCSDIESDIAAESTFIRCPKSNRYLLDTLDII